MPEQHLVYLLPDRADSPELGEVVIGFLNNQIDPFTVKTPAPFTKIFMKFLVGCNKDFNITEDFINDVGNKGLAVHKKQRLRAFFG